MLINGEDIKGKKLGEVCREVGVVLQNADEQIIQKTVEDEIAFGCENLAFSPEKISKQIDIVCKLMKLERSWQCRKLSGGQKQRAAVARALITNPQIILADEPTGALDSKSSEQLLTLFNEINCDGQTILMVTHSTKAASRANRVLFIKDGVVFHQIYKGSMTDDSMYTKISDTLTALATGGDNIE